MSANTGGPASEKTLLDEFAGQALAGLYGAANDRSYKLRLDGNEPIKRSDVARDCYAMASAMLAEKARREAVVRESSTNPDAGKMVWKQSQNMGSAIVCETQFSDEHADDENVKAYDGFLVAESVPEEAKAIIIRAPQLEAANRELVEALESCDAAFSKFSPQEESAYGMAWSKVRAILAKHKGAA